VTRLTTVLLFIILCASCDTNFTQGLGDLFNIQKEVAKVVGTKNVTVNINNGTTLTVNIINSSLNTGASQDRKLTADKVAQVAYEEYTDRQKLTIIYVLFSSYEKKFAVVEMTSTVEMFEYSPKDFATAKVALIMVDPYQPNKALQPTACRFAAHCG